MTATMTIVSGYALRSGAKVHAVDLDTAFNRVAEAQNIVDLRSGVPIRESVCGIPVTAGELPWTAPRTIGCRRCVAATS